MTSGDPGDHFAKHQPHYQDSKQLGILWGRQIFKETRMREIFASRKELNRINWRQSNSLEVPQVAAGRVYQGTPPITYLDKGQVAELAVPYEGIRVWDGAHCINHSLIKEWAANSYPVFATNNQKAIMRIANELAGKLKGLLGKKVSVPVSQTIGPPPWKLLDMAQYSTSPEILDQLTDHPSSNSVSSDDQITSEMIEQVRTLIGLKDELNLEWLKTVTQYSPEILSKIVIEHLGMFIQDEKVLSKEKMERISGSG